LSGYPDAASMTDILQRNPPSPQKLESLLLDQIEASVILADVQGVVTGWNRHAETLYGWTHDEAVGRTILDLVVGPDEALLAADLLHTLQRGQRWEGEFPMRRKDGGTVLALLTLSPLVDEDGTLLGMAGLSIDITERRRQERRIAAQHAVTKTLSEADTLVGAAPQMLGSLSAALGWEVGGMWAVDEGARVLRLVTLWHDPAVSIDEFERRCQEIEFRPGVGLPGRVWKSGSATWIPDVVRDRNFPRAAIASRAGLHGAFAFPIVLGREVLGVVEFFSHEIRQPDEDLLAMVSAIGSQIGQFVERKQAEAALRESEARKGAMLEAALDAVVAMDAEGNIAEFNPAAEAMFGHARTEVIGKHMATLLVPPSLRERHYAGLARYLATGKSRIMGKRLELRALRADGTEFPTELTVTRVDLPGPPMFTAYIRDTSSRVEAERASARLAALVETTADAVFGKSLDGVIESWNRGAERIYGYRAGETVGRHVSMLQAPGRQNDVEEIMAIVRSGGVVRRETVRRRKDGTLIDVDLTVSPIRNRLGVIVGASTVARDITERKLAEQRLRFLAEASQLLAGSLDYRGTLESLAGLAVPDFSDWSIVYGLQADGSIRRLAMAHQGEAMAAAGEEIQRFRMRPDARRGVPEVIRTGQSHLVSDASPEQLSEDVEDREGLIELLRPLDLRSWICVPLTARGRTLGAISFVRSGEGRRYDAGDLGLAEELARHAAIALDNALLYEAERDARRATEEAARQITLLQNVTAALSEAMTAEQVAEVVVDRGVRALGAQSGLIALVDAEGTSLEILRSIGYLDDTMARWRRFPLDGPYPLSGAVRTGEPVLLPTLKARTTTYPDLDVEAGTPDHALACIPLSVEGRTIGGMTLSFGQPRIFTDRDRALLLALGRQCAQALQRANLFEAERSARSEAERTREQLAFLAEASATLSASLDYTKTLAQVTRLAVPRLADWCGLDVVEEDGSLRQLAVAHVDPAKVKLARQLRKRYPPRPDDPTGVSAVVRTGRPELYPEVSDELIAASTPDPKVRQLVRDLRLRSIMIVPLHARGTTVGAMTFVWAESDRRYGPDDLSLAEDLARRAGQAIENARLYAERDHIAHTLQQSLLPPELPAIAGVELAARYLPAGEGNEVGGDFYDVFDTGDGTWGIVVGDVCGKGAAAAAVMGLARYTLRATAMRERKPSRILATLNEAVRRQTTEGRFITVSYSRLRTRPEGARLTVSCGGHPLPLLLRADGSLETAGQPGTLLGLFPDPVLSDSAIDLHPGDAMITFTDGVTEIPGASLEGERRLADVLKSCAGHGADAIAERVERDVMRRGRRRIRDDMAVLVLRVAG
jgi:PAS domain S-box-containing protein